MKNKNRIVALGLALGMFLGASDTIRANTKNLNLVTDTNQTNELLNQDLYDEFFGNLKEYYNLMEELGQMALSSTINDTTVDINNLGNLKYVLTDENGKVLTGWSIKDENGEFHIVDKYGNHIENWHITVNPEGQMIDENGEYHTVDKHGNYIENWHITVNPEGFSIDEDGNLIDEDGNLVEVDENGDPILNSDNVSNSGQNENGNGMSEVSGSDWVR